MDKIKIVNSDLYENNLEDESVSVSGVVALIAENFRMFVAAPIVFGLIGYGGASFIKPTYIAHASFLVPQQQGGFTSLFQSIGAAGSLASAASGIKNPADQYVSLLGSSSVTNELVTRFDLQKRYDAAMKIDARKALEKRTSIRSGKDNIINVEVEDEDAQFAALLSNAYGEELTKLLGRLSITEAQQRRVFFTKQLLATKSSLIAAELALAETGVSVATINANPIAALEGPTRLRALIATQEVKLAAMRSYLTDSAPDFRQASAELNALHKELTRVELSRPSTNDKPASYIAKYREFKYQESLFDSFSKQLELARLDESRESAALQVVDIATPPERKARPRKGMIALVGVAAGLLLAGIFAMWKNVRKKVLANPEEAARWIAIRQAFKRSMRLG